MKTMNRAGAWLVLTCAAFFGTGCAEIQALFDPLLTASTISVEEEIEVGKELKKQVEEGATLVEDAFVVDYVKGVGEIVLANSPFELPVPVEFAVVQDDSINAFAIPGGYIYVHTGLIDAAEDEAELAGVMAHELGHVIWRHGAKQLSRAMTAQMVQQVLLGEDAGAGAQLLGQLLATGTLTSYSREAEFQADDVAVPTLRSAEYDPAAIITFFQTLNEASGSTGGMAAWFASHPPTPERIARAESMISGLESPGPSHRPINELRKVQARLQEIGTSSP